jgi:hypothetical protein
MIILSTYHSRKSQVLSVLSPGHLNWKEEKKKTFPCIFDLVGEWVDQTFEDTNLVVITHIKK